MNKYNPSKSVGHYLKVKMYAELIGNYKNQGIKSLWDNKLDDGIRGPQGSIGETGKIDLSLLENYATKTYVGENAAPAGFGLGGNGRGIDSLDNATKFGVYISNQGTPSIELNNTSVYWTCLTMPHNENYILQIAYRSGQNPSVICIRRHNADGTWGLWEYLNPPMNIGYEYPTTERHKGKVVYRQLVEITTTETFGEENKVSTYSMPHGISGLTHCVEIYGNMGNYRLPYMATGGALTSIALVNTTNIQFRLEGAWSGERTWTFDIRYTKN